MIWYLTFLLIMRDANYRDIPVTVRYATVSQMECFNQLTRLKFSMAPQFADGVIVAYCVTGEPQRVEVK